MKLKTKMLYGLSSIGESGLYNLIGTFALFFLTTVAGINPAAAGTITAVGAIWETFCGAVIGYVSDNTETKYGKRKPYILIASIPLAVFTALFFVNINAGGGLNVVYYGFMLVMFWSAFSVFYVPYLAWGAELTQDYDERTVLRGFTFFFATIGMVIGLVLPNIVVDFFMSKGMTLSQSWMLNGVLCSVVCGAAIFIGAIGIKDRYELDYDEEKAISVKAEKIAAKQDNGGFSITGLLASALDMIKNYLQILKLRTVRYIIGASVCFLIAYAIFNSVRMYYFTYNMQLSAGYITLIMLLLTFASIIFIPLVLFLSKHFDKKTAFVIGMTISALVMAAYGWLGVSSAFDIIVFSAAYSIGSITYWQLIPAMIYDACEVDELKSNKRRGGLVISLQSLSESLANAVGLQIMGIILSFAGFQGDAAVQTERALSWISLSFSVIPAVFMLVSAYCIIKYPVSKNMYLKVVEALKERADGKNIDMDKFRKL